jgi:hypothetical protein
MPTTRRGRRTRTRVRADSTLIRKTSLLQDHSDDERGQASADMNCAGRSDHLAMTITIGCIGDLRARCQRKPDGSPPRMSARSDLLFTMSDNSPTSQTLA